MSNILSGPPGDIRIAVKAFESRQFFNILNKIFEIVPSNTIDYIIYRTDDSCITVSVKSSSVRQNFRHADYAGITFCQYVLKRMNAHTFLKQSKGLITKIPCPSPQSNCLHRLIAYFPAHSIFGHDDGEGARMRHLDMLDHVTVLCRLRDLRKELRLHVSIEPAVLSRVLRHNAKKVVSNHGVQMVRIDSGHVTDHT